MGVPFHPQMPMGRSIRPSDTPALKLATESERPFDETMKSPSGQQVRTA